MTSRAALFQLYQERTGRTIATLPPAPDASKMCAYFRDRSDLSNEVKRTPAYQIIGGESKTREWVWVWSGSPDWRDNLERC